MVLDHFCCYSLDYFIRFYDYRKKSMRNLKLSDVQQPLTRETYREKFHNLLYYEELDHEKTLNERSVIQCANMTFHLLFCSLGLYLWPIYSTVAQKGH